MEQIKSIRRHLDHLMIQSKQLSSNREMALAFTNMQRGSMWLGLVLAAIGTTNPYPESTNTANKTIEDRADQAKDSPATFEGMAGDGDRTIQVKWLRGQLDGLVNSLSNLKYADQINPGDHELQVATDAIREAKMWYGWELNNIHEANK